MYQLIISAMYDFIHRKKCTFNLSYYSLKKTMVVT